MAGPTSQDFCCGRSHRYSGGISSHFCPEGKRMLCEECATKGKTVCPVHKVPVRF
jgi:hypothetical protein